VSKSNQLSEFEADMWAIEDPRKAKTIWVNPGLHSEIKVKCGHFRSKGYPAMKSALFWCADVVGEERMVDIPILMDVDINGWHVEYKEAEEDTWEGSTQALMGELQQKTTNELNNLQLRLPEAWAKYLGDTRMKYPMQREYVRRFGFIPIVVSPTANTYTIEPKERGIPMKSKQTITLIDVTINGSIHLKETIVQLTMNETFEVIDDARAIPTFAERILQLKTNEDHVVVPLEGLQLYGFCVGIINAKVHHPGLITITGFEAGKPWVKLKITGYLQAFDTKDRGQISANTEMGKGMKIVDTALFRVESVEKILLVDKVPKVNVGELTIEEFEIIITSLLETNHSKQFTNPVREKAGKLVTKLRKRTNQ
jgi:hypothetical protein